MKPVILFESYPDFNCSPLAIYEELIKRGYDKKYDLVWAVYSDFNLKTDYKTVKFFNCNSIEKQDIIKRTKCIIDSNRYIPKFSSNVFRLHTTHGCNLKNCNWYCKQVGSVDALITTSNDMLELETHCWPVNKEKFIILGMPSLDKLFHPKSLYNGFIQELSGNNKFSKIIGWFPTFREHRFGGASVGKKYKYGLPIINNINEVNKLNEQLKNTNILLLVQMHHAQKNNYENLSRLSNIVFVNETIKNKYNLSTMDLLGNCDGMITDYSSIYHEYIILNRPIALTIDDLQLYAKSPGFICNYLDWIKGDYLLDSKDLCSWINNISNNIDESKLEREKSLNKIHKFKDDKSTKRVVDYLINTAKL